MLISETSPISQIDTIDEKIFKNFTKKVAFSVLFIYILVIVTTIILLIFQIKNCDYLIDYYEYKKEYINSSNKTPDEKKKEINNLEKNSKERKQLALFNKYFIICFIIYTCIVILLFVSMQYFPKIFDKVNDSTFIIIFACSYFLYIISFYTIVIISIAISSINIENYRINEKDERSNNVIYNKYDDYYANKEVSKTHSQQIFDRQIVVLVFNSLLLLFTLFRP